MLMVCQHCKSKDIIAVQGQNYCLNCGHLVVGSASDKAPKAAAVSTPKVAAPPAPATAQIIKHSTKVPAPKAGAKPALGPARRFVSDLVLPDATHEIEAPPEQVSLPPAHTEVKAKAPHAKQVVKPKSTARVAAASWHPAYLSALLSTWSLFIVFYFGHILWMFPWAEGTYQFLGLATASGASYLLIWLLLRSWVQASLWAGAATKLPATQVARLAWNRMGKIAALDLVYFCLIGLQLIGLGWLRHWQPGPWLTFMPDWLWLALGATTAVLASLWLLALKYSAQYYAVTSGKGLAAAWYGAHAAISTQAWKWFGRALAWTVLVAACYSLFGLGLLLALRLEPVIVPYATAAVLAGAVVLAAGLKQASASYWSLGGLKWVVTQLQLTRRRWVGAIALCTLLAAGACLWAYWTKGGLL